MLIVFVYISRHLIVFVYISLLGKTIVIALKNIITALVDSVCLYRPSCLFIYAYFPWDHLGESDHLGPGLRSTQVIVWRIQRTHIFSVKILHLYLSYFELSVENNDNKSSLGFADTQLPSTLPSIMVLFPSWKPWREWPIHVFRL